MESTQPIHEIETLMKKEKDRRMKPSSELLKKRLSLL
jgi:hypothetical protein